MTESETTLNDQILFAFCDEYAPKLGFLSEDSMRILKDLRVRVSSGSIGPSDGKDLMSLWQNLVTDWNMDDQSMGRGYESRFC